MITTLSILVFILVHGCVTQDASGWYNIVSNCRIEGSRFRANGNILKALPSKLSVSFTGTNADDPTSVFLMERSNDKWGWTFSYREGNYGYYLSVEKDGKVQLRKLNGFPSEDKYFFRILAWTSYKFRVLKSLKTGEYLHCDDTGKAFMEKAGSLRNGHPQDRNSWMQLWERSSKTAL